MDCSGKVARHEKCARADQFFDRYDLDGMGQPKAQAEQAREIFQKIQDYLKAINALKERRFPYDKFPLYLRVLDAIEWKESLPKDEKFTYSDIYKVLFDLKTLKQADDSSYRATISEDLKVARQWRDSDFRLLFAS